MSSNHLHLFRPPIYGELKARHDETVTDNLPNRHAAINGWMECHGYSDGTRIENEFGTDYSDRLKAYLGQFAASTQSSRKTILNRYQSVYFELLESGKLPIGFHECLRVLIVPFEKDLAKLAKTADVALVNLKAWLGGITPGFPSKESLGRLERQFGVPKGTLVNRLPHLRLGKRAYQTGQTTYGRRIQELQSPPFRLEFNHWPTLVQKQWQALVKHKTATLLPKGELRNKKWNIDKRGRCISAETRLGWTEDFFGYLVLSLNEPNLKLRGKAYSIEDLNLTLLSDTELVNDFLEFLKVRTGVYTEFCRVFLDFVHSLCLANCGWLVQQPALASHRLIASQLPDRTLVHRKSIELTSVDDQ